MIEDNSVLEMQIRQLNHQFYEELVYYMEKMFGLPLTKLALDEPEMDDLLHYIVKSETDKAISKVESFYINKAFKQSQDSSANVLNACLAGAKLKDQERDKE